MKYFIYCTITSLVLYIMSPILWADTENKPKYRVKLDDQIYHELTSKKIIQDGKFLEADSVEAKESFVIFKRDGFELWLQAKDVLYIHSIAAKDGVH
ncbi:MAG: hypothetical protein AAF571_04270 [Verrucomicrobiota bacterium]